MSKNALINRILYDLRNARNERWSPPPNGPVKRVSFPPVLPIEDGVLSVTEDVLAAVHEYSEIWSNNDSSLKARFKKSELSDLAGRAFGQALASIDLDHPDAELTHHIRRLVDDSLCILARYDHKPVEVVLGCHLLEGENAYPIHIGPVSFETREQWLHRSTRMGRTSSTTTRRLKAMWAGGRVRRRKPSLDEHAERSIIDAIGECPIICTVEADGLSSKMLQEKSGLAARLAMTAISMMWSHPSQGLTWMNLLIDGRAFHKCYAVFGAGRHAGSFSSISQMPKGRWTDEELIAEVKRFQPIYDILGEAIRTFVQPDAPAPRPTLAASIFLSLWWLQAGCREQADQIATAKFVASMDALVTGDDPYAILKFLKARAGYEADSRLMTDGRTAKAVIFDLYSVRRSKLLHGSSVDFAHDWSSARATAESLAQFCLILACTWMTKNPEVDALAELSKPESGSENQTKNSTQ